MTAEESSLQELTAYRAKCGRCQYELPKLRTNTRLAVWQAKDDGWEYIDGEWICSLCMEKERYINERTATKHADSAD